MAKHKSNDSFKGLPKELMHGLDGFLDDFFKGLPKNPEDADDATIQRFVRNALKGSLGTTSAIKPPAKKKLAQGEAMTFGGEIIGGKKSIKKPIFHDPPSNDIKKTSLVIPSEISEVGEIVDFLAERIADTDETAIRTSLNKFSAKELQEIADDATDRSNTSCEMKSIMYIVQSVRVRKRKIKNKSNSSGIPVGSTVSHSGSLWYDSGTK